VIISHRHKFIFIKTRKTAGTSIEVFLSEHCGPEDVLTPLRPPVASHVPRNYRSVFNPLPELLDHRGARATRTVKDFLTRKRFHAHMWGRDVRNRISRRVWDTYFKFCVERNPWEKAISQYHYLIGKGRQPASLDEYLRGDHSCINFPFYLDRDNQLIVDRILKYEHLDAELADVFARLGIPFNGSLGVRAKGQYRVDRRPYWEVLTGTQIDAISERYRREIDLLGYTPRRAGAADG
jgi:hypothetical protein